jgi:SAM-dependent methyltransferase
LTSKVPWYESFFGKDFLEIYDDALTEERTTAEVDGIISLLRLEPGARVLDLACGHGRHAMLLAERGYDVTGFDLSGTLLDRARAVTEARGASVRWIQGDMRQLSFDAEFDAVINIFTAFGYFEDPADDAKMLRGVREALDPEGRFLMETLHRDGLPARFQRRGFQKTPNGTIILHEREWDLARDVIDEEVTLIRTDGTRSMYTTSVRLHSLDELIGLARCCGLEPERWHGGLDGSTLGLLSRRLVLVCRPALAMSRQGDGGDDSPASGAIP